MTDVRPVVTVRDQARKQLGSVAWTGGAVLAVGLLILSITLGVWRESSPYDDAAVILALFVGALVTSAGAVLLLVAAVGWGVRLGREAAGQGDERLGSGPEPAVRSDGPDVRARGL